MKAIWKGAMIAKSEDVEEIEGKFYFPIDSLKKEYFLESNTQNVCPYNGRKIFFHVMVEGDVNEDAAWYFHEPSSPIFKNKVMFGKGILIRESSRKINLELLKVLNSFF